MAYHHDIGEWHGKTLVDRDGERIGKLEDVYVDVETNEPMFGTVKEGLIGRHLTFVPWTESRSAPTTCSSPPPRTWSNPPPTSNSTATSSPRQTSRPSTTTTNSTTPHPTPNAAADSPGANAPPGVQVTPEPLSTALTSTPCSKIGRAHV